MKFRSLTFIVVACSLTFTGMPAFAQEMPQIDLEMSQITPALITIASKTQFFLDLTSDLQITADQITKLQDLLFQAELSDSRFSADLRIAGAQIERLLAEPKVDLKALQQMLEKRHQLAAQSDFSTLKFVISAIQILSHEQHIKSIPAFRKWLKEKGEIQNDLKDSLEESLKS